jgi:hypothetical protein
MIVPGCLRGQLYRTMSEDTTMKCQVKLTILIAVFALAMGIHSLHAEDQVLEEGWKKFEGAWFEIKYPADFLVEPSLKGLTSTEGFDSAFFSSPGKEVAFYVFSPQWNGEPTDILLNKDSEDQKSFEEVEKDGKKVRLCTIAAKDGSYTRTYEDVEDPQTNTRHVFGIRFQDQKALDQYKDQFKKFQESLEQFAD